MSKSLLSLLPAGLIVDQVRVDADRVVVADRAQTLQAAAVERAALPPAMEGQWWPQPATPNPENGQRRRAALAAHLAKEKADANQKADANPAASAGSDAVPPTPAEGLDGIDEDGVARILRALGGIEARLSAIEAVLGLAQANGQSGALYRVAAVGRRLGAQRPAPTGDGQRPPNVRAYDESGAEAQPPSPSANQDMSGRYVFAPGEQLPF